MSVRLRRRLVRGLGAEGAVGDAFAAVPREAFVPEWVSRVGLAKIYEPGAVLVTQTDDAGRPTSSSSAPSIMAPMLSSLDVQPGHRVLEIGAGTGYNAALLAHLVGPKGRVTTIDVDPKLTRRARQALASVGVKVKVIDGDGRDGWPAGAPYDRIIATVASPTVPRTWYDQLTDGGLLEFPYQVVGLGAIPTLRKHHNRLTTESVVLGGFVSMRGSAADKAVAPQQLFIHQTAAATSRSEGFAGAGLRSLPSAARARLMHLLIDGPTFARWHDPNPTGYLTLGDRHSIQYQGYRGWGAAVVAADGTAAAAVVRTQKDRVRLLTWGSGAHQLLDDRLVLWRKLSCPTIEHLRLTVTFSDTGPARIRTAWTAG
jgi:protein-L-isoaspartate(D-aspartate) O-methyltransferase